MGYLFLQYHFSGVRHTLLERIARTWPFSTRVARSVVCVQWRSNGVGRVRKVQGTPTPEFQAKHLCMLIKRLTALQILGCELF